MTPDLWLTLNRHKLGSPFEEMFVRQVLSRLEELDFSKLDAQTPFKDIDGRQRYCDFTYEVPGRYKIAMEVDGFDKQGRGSGMSHDEFIDWQRRHAALVAAGWDVVRFANRDVRDQPGRCLRYLQLMMAQSRHGTLSDSDQSALDQLEKSLRGAQSALELAEAEKARLEKAHDALKHELSGARTNVTALNQETRHLKTAVWAFAFVLVTVMGIGIVTYKDVLESQQGGSPAAASDMAATAPAAMTVSNPTPAASASSAPAAPGDTCANPIAWDEADRHVGQRKAVAGPIKAISTRDDVNGRPTFISLGAAFPSPERFTLVIWGDDRHAFQPLVTQTAELTGRTACAVGQITEFRQLPQIVLTERSQLTIQP